MMNAAMMIAPAPSGGTIRSGSRVAQGQEQLFGRALAQQGQQAMCRTAEQEQFGLSGRPEKSELLSNVAELLGSDAAQLLELPVEQQDLLAQMDAEMLDGLALLLEQGTVPNSMDHAQLQQLVDLVEEVLPDWQFHSQGAVAEQDSEQVMLPEKQDQALEQKVEELIAWFNQYQEQVQVQSQELSRSQPGQSVAGELPPGQLVAAQKLEQVRERLGQLRVTMAENGDNAEPVKAEGEAKGTQMAAAAVRSGDPSARRESSDSSLEARFSELLKPRQGQAGQQQATESGRQTQQAQQAPVNQAPMAESADGFFAQTLDKSAPQVPLAQPAMNAKQVADGIVSQHNQLHGQPAPTAGTRTITAPPAVAVPFAASQQVADSQIFDQVVTHLSGSDKGDMGRMVLRLHPAELGSLRIELMVEGDRVRANLHAQTQQVQEVLERNLGQLRHSLAEQGLKIDHFQVSSDARQNQQHGQADNLAHQRHGTEHSTQHRHANKEEQLQEDQAIPLAHLTRNGGRGISLHV